MDAALDTYASAALILTTAAITGQAVFALAGWRQWSWLSPAVGLGVLGGVAWGTVRIADDGVAALAAVTAVTVASLAVLRGRVQGAAGPLRAGLPAAALALMLASLPFIVEGRFGILGTGLNPDMSQHLFAADRLLSGESERLIAVGYPLGPHALVAAVAGSTGIGLVQAFDGLTLSISVSAVLAALAAFEALGGGRRLFGALLVGLPYLVASFLIQGAFKETLEALFVLAFAIGLHQLATGGQPKRLAALPLAALAVGAAYCYSFPGLLWLAGTAALWLLVGVARGAQAQASVPLAEVAGRLARVAAVPIVVAAIAIAPEIGRMIDFARFETFDPDGPGLGNLFNSLSPAEALGIWPSGDFRLEPGDGAVPAAGYVAGALVALVALGHGFRWMLRHGELAAIAALDVAILLYLYAVFAGTPYQESKALAIAAPLAMLVAAKPLLVATAPAPGRRPGAAVTALAVAFLGGATGCSVLALANGPVGPTGYSPALAELRPALQGGSTLALAPAELLDEQHGRDYLVWELRGNRVCVEPLPAGPLGPGIAHVVVVALDPVAVESVAEQESASGAAPCPLITDGQRAELSAE